MSFLHIMTGIQSFLRKWHDTVILLTDICLDGSARLASKVFWQVSQAGKYICLDGSARLASKVFWQVSQAGKYICLDGSAKLASIYGLRGQPGWQVYMSGWISPAGKYMSGRVNQAGKYICLDGSARLASICLDGSARLASIYVWWISQAGKYIWAERSARLASTYVWWINPAGKYMSGWVSQAGKYICLMDQPG